MHPIGVVFAIWLAARALIDFIRAPKFVPTVRITLVIGGQSQLPPFTTG
jgi:hypothetical protein